MLKCVSILTYLLEKCKHGFFDNNQFHTLDLVVSECLFEA